MTHDIHALACSLLVACAPTSIAHPKNVPRSVLPAYWSGAFEPDAMDPMDRDDASFVVGKRTLARGAGVIRIDPKPYAPEGAVVAVNPFYGKQARGEVVTDDERGLLIRLDDVEFNLNTDDLDDLMLVFPAGTELAVVPLTTHDRNAIIDEANRYIGASWLEPYELGAVDLDGDLRADVVVTSGCNGTADQRCMSEGQTVVSRQGEHWKTIESSGRALVDK